ncbi:MAG: hypothetical protein IPN38_14550 [Flavobacteriales bacterium]|nr:hypothetical protein [Flavobacteriales bacterium]
MNTERNNSLMPMTPLADLVMRSLARRGLRHHPLTYDLCHTCLVELMEQGVGHPAQERIDQMVEKVVASEVDHQQRRVFWDDMAYVTELRAQGVM